MDHSGGGLRQGRGQAKVPALAVEASRRPELDARDGAAEREQVITNLKQIGYAPHSTKDSGEAIERLRLSDYAIVVVSDGFDPPGKDGPSIQAYLSGMGMTRRRNIDVVLIDPGLASNDQQAAFAHSVDLVLHPNDLPHFEKAQGHSKAEKEIRYHVLKESLRAMGKT